MNMIGENIEIYERIDVRTHGDALETAVKMIAEKRKERGISLEHKYILFVPDKYTLLAEKLLYAAEEGAECGGAFDSEVLTLNRLYYRVAEEVRAYSEADSTSLSKAGSPLSRIGAVLTVRRILSEIGKDLDCYKSSAHTVGFSETVYDNLCQFAASGLSSGDLEIEGGDVTALKLKDLQKIYKAYEDATVGKYVDSSGRMKLLCDLLKSTHLFDDTDVYFACFDGFTPLQESVVKIICEKAKVKNSAVVIESNGALDLRAKRLLRCRCRSRADELKMAAVRIKDLVKNYGARYGEIAVIAPSADFNRLQRIFDEYEVPFFTDRKYALSSHPMARYLLDLFSASEHGRNDDYIKLAHNPYSGVERGDADIFENYIAFCALHDGAVESGFPETADHAMKDSFTVAEKVRKSVAARVKTLKDQLKKKQNKQGLYNGEGMCAVIEKVLPEEDEKLSKRMSSQIEDVRKKIKENADLLKEVFDTPAKLSVMLEALEEIFALYSVSVLPNRADCVVVGDTSVFRAGGYKYLFVLSMHEGEIPAVMHDDGMLSDADLDIFAKRSNKKIEPKIEDLNARAIDELNSVLSYANEEIYISFCDDGKPSSVISGIISAANKKNVAVAEFSRDAKIKLSPSDNAAEEKFVKFDDISLSSLTGVAAKADMVAVEFSRDAMLYKLLDGDEVSAQLLVTLCPTVDAAGELYLLGSADKQMGGMGLGYEDELKEAVKTELEKAIEEESAEAAKAELREKADLLNRVERTPKAENASALYGDEAISISQVQDYFSCPFRCYAEYALKLKPRPKGKVTPLDLGIFLHEVMERYFNESAESGDYSNAENKVARAVEDILEKNPQALKGESERFISDLIKEAVRACNAAGKHIENGKFEPVFSEGKFGLDKDNKLPAYEIELSEGIIIKLKGKIDRMDVTDNKGEKAVRIIDYKTGNGEYHSADVYYGRKVQLPMYLKVATKRVAAKDPLKPVGMFYFPFASDFEANESSYRLLGRFDKDYAYEMDRGLANEKGYKSTVVNAASNSGSSEKNVILSGNGTSGIDGDVLKGVCDYAEEVLKIGAREMLKGYCEPSPFTTGQNSVCDYCEVKPFCQTYGLEKKERVDVGGINDEFLIECVDGAKKADTKSGEEKNDG